MVCWLLYGIRLLYGKWDVVRYVGFSLVCALFYSIWAVVWYEGSCIVCGLLYFNRAVVWYKFF